MLSKMAPPMMAAPTPMATPSHLWRWVDPADAGDTEKIVKVNMVNMMGTDIFFIGCLLNFFMVGIGENLFF